MLSKCFHCKPCKGSKCSSLSHDYKDIFNIQDEELALKAVPVSRSKALNFGLVSCKWKGSHRTYLEKTIIMSNSIVNLRNTGRLTLATNIFNHAWPFACSIFFSVTDFGKHYFWVWVNHKWIGKISMVFDGAISPKVNVSCLMHYWYHSRRKS